MAQNIELDIFSPRVGEMFVLDVSGNAGERLELVEVNALPSQGGPREQPFALIFKGPGGSGQQQGMVKLTHDDMGEFDIFLVPVEEDQRGRLFEAIFN